MLLDLLRKGLGIGLDGEEDIGERLSMAARVAVAFERDPRVRQALQFICTSTTPGTARSAPAIWGVAMYLPGSLTSTSRSPSSRIRTRETSPSPRPFSRS